MKGKMVFIVIFIACVSMLALGCTGKNTTSPTTTATNNPITTNNPAGTQSTTTTPGSATITPVPSVSINTSNVNMSTFDDSLVSVSNETDESLPENEIPTPDTGNQ